METTQTDYQRNSSSKGPYREGGAARGIEKVTARMPSDLFLWSALGSMAASLTLKCFGRKHDALFVGQWAAPFLLLGVYNKIVKVAGHDKEDGRAGGEEEPQEQ